MIAFPKCSFDRQKNDDRGILGVSASFLEEIKMLKRTLGKTGLETSILGLGVVSSEEPQATSLAVQLALEGDINFIDTARGYGESEKKLGSALGSKRSEFILATKTRGFRKEKALQELEESLRQLKTDYIDLWQWHCVHNEEELDAIMAPGGAYEAMREAKEKGYVRFIGATGHRPAILVETMKRADFDTIMIAFNITRQQYIDNILGKDPTAGFFEMAKRQNLGVVIMKPMAAGRIQKNAKNALKFVLAHDVSVAIPGVGKLEHLKENIEVAKEFSALSFEQQAAYQWENVILGEGYCRACDYCMPCEPSNNNIPALLRSERYCTVFGLPEWIRAYQLTVNTTKCDDCGICEAKCPFDLPIREMLENSKRFLGVS